jgi:hypothetical protein
MRIRPSSGKGRVDLARIDLITSVILVMSFVHVGEKVVTYKIRRCTSMQLQIGAVLGVHCAGNFALNRSLTALSYDFSSDPLGKSASESSKVKGDPYVPNQSVIRLAS